MAPASIDQVQMAQSSSPSSPARGSSCADRPRFSNLRGVRWRIDLGILSSSADASIEDLRRVTADSRRRYASIRRCLLIDPHIHKGGNRSPDLVIDNPLSQNPDSMWGRFFQNAEMEKMVDQDLSRLYPEQGSYFQTPTCQAILRRILLLWCLRHPEYGYRQGMHELLAPLVYVLHIDVQRLSDVRKLHEDQFNDEFDGRSFLESKMVPNYGLTKSKSWNGEADEERCDVAMGKVGNFDELDSETRDIILLSDAYGAEGELGIALSERFMEHDAYCMFDALMNGAHGVVAIADFFSLSPASGSSTGLTPVIEASSALYHLLSIVDSSLHRHLVELGVEPQYFALRWLRVLFGREFSLQDILVIWDEIFSSFNSICHLSTDNESQLNFRMLCSPRGAFISAMAVSMILHLRSSLLATENATTCLQRLLNFPETVNMKELIDKAKSLQALALDTNISNHSGSLTGWNNSVLGGYSISSGSVSPKTPLYSLPESYWEEKWRVLHKAEDLQKGCQSDPTSEGILSRSFGRGKFSLSRTGSDPSPAKMMGDKKNSRATVRRRLLDDLSQETDSEVTSANVEHGGLTDPSGAQDPLSLEINMEKNCLEDSTVQNTIEKDLYCMGEEACFSGENSSEFSIAASPQSVSHEHENYSEKSSVSSNSCTGDDEEEVTHAENLCNTAGNLLPGDMEINSTTVVTDVGSNPNAAEKQALIVKEKKPTSGKFHWFWKFGKGGNEGIVEKGAAEVSRSTTGNVQDYIPGSSSASFGNTSRPEVGDKKMLGTLKNLGQSMLENIQVLESAFQQDRGQVGSLENLSNNILGGKGQATAMAALMELRKISNLLFEM